MHRVQRARNWLRLCIFDKNPLWFELICTCFWENEKNGHECLSQSPKPTPPKFFCLFFVCLVMFDTKPLYGWLFCLCLLMFEFPIFQFVCCLTNFPTKPLGRVQFFTDLTRHPNITFLHYLGGLVRTENEILHSAEEFLCWWTFFFYETPIRTYVVRFFRLQIFVEQFDNTMYQNDIEEFFRCVMRLLSSFRHFKTNSEIF